MSPTQGLAICYLSGGQGGKIMFRYFPKGTGDTPSSSYELTFTGNTPRIDAGLISPVGALAWDEVKHNFRLLLTRNLLAGFPSKAWVLDVSVNLGLVTLERLPAGRHHWLDDGYADVDQKGLWECTQMASLVVIQDKLWATMSHFFPHNDNNTFLTGLDNLDLGGICRTKNPGERDFSVRKDGTAFPDEFHYVPSSNWYCGLTNKPMVNLRSPGGGMPGQLVLLPSSTCVFGLYYDDSRNSFWLGHAPSSMLNDLTPDSTTTQLWTFLNVTSPSLTLYSATLCAIQGTNAESKPRLYVFCVHKDDRLGEDLGLLSAFSIPLQGKGISYGELDLPPGTTTFDVQNNHSRLAAHSDDGFNLRGAMVGTVASTRFRLRAVTCDGNIAIFYHRNGNIYMWRNEIQADGNIVFDSRYGLVQATTEGGSCMLVGACTVPTSSFP